MLREMPEPESTYEARKKGNATRKGSKNKIGSLGSEEQFLDKEGQNKRRTIKLAREERTRRNTEQKKNMKVENIGLD